MVVGNQEVSGNKVVSTQERKRVFFFDNLRTALTCLVLTNHASQAYVSMDTGWIIRQSNVPEINDKIIGIFLSVNNAFFMALFFMISSYFIPASLERKYASQYIKERLIKLGIPILLFIFFILPLLRIKQYSGEMSAVDFLSKRYFSFSTGEINFGHTWFLVVLLMLSCLYLLYCKLVKINGSPKENNINTSAPGTYKIILFTAGLTLLLFVTRIFLPPGDWAIFHLFEPARMPAYIAMFIIGIAAYKKRWVDKMPVSTGKIWGIVSVLTILSTPFLLTFILKGKDMWAKGLTLNSLIVSAWDALLCVGLCISLTILFREKFNYQGKVLKRAADDSYGVYLLHPFIVIPFQYLLLNLPIHAFLKFIMATIIGIILSYLICRLIKKIPRVSRVL
jgi:surface polysaccharide O-acyltransferase-like enzyme